MLGGAITAGYLLLQTDLGWVASPLIGDAVGIFLYVVVSMLTFGIRQRGGKLIHGQVITEVIS